eukprot:TRINITY_DN28074_c0_g1_i1.p1 TRINITY_DN28074_c0_g1~~TRINITY_DN28074_c0_g1_i1.p1  ORF type:complete len:738 (+),score=308.62 TRINITY_DN28074_c0_g1_i1:80-2293(+)
MQQHSPPDRVRKRGVRCGMGAAALCGALYLATLFTQLTAVQARRGVVAAGAHQVVHFGHHGRHGRHADQEMRQRRRERSFNIHFAHNVRELKSILHRKLLLEQVLDEDIVRLQAVRAKGGSEGEEVERKLSKRRIRRRMLKELEQGVMRKARKLDELMRNMTDDNLRHSSRSLLLGLQEESVRAREDYSAAVAVERAERESEHRRKAHESNGTGVVHMIRSVDAELEKAVGAVQHELDADAAWEHARAQGGAEMETVVKVVDRGRHALAHSVTGDHEVGLVSTLVDHDNNRYVLARPHDSSIRYEDEGLLFDVVRVVSCCYAAATLAHALGLPLFFGYVAAGTLLSPTQLNMLQNLVQIETLAQIGVYLMLFLLGAEFSADKVRRVMRPAVGGGIACMALMILFAAALLTLLFDSLAAEGVLIGFCFCLSSTAVVLKCLTEAELATQYGRILLGVLVVQDVSLGVMVAVVPLLNGSGDGPPLREIASLCVALAVLCAVTAASSKLVVARFLRVSATSSELFVVGLVALCFVQMWLSKRLGLSMEVGAFTTGISLAPSGREWISKVEAAVRPVQDLFAAMFFAAIGFHVYPSFLLREIVLLLSVTLFVVGVKYAVGLCVFSLLCGVDFYDASLLALGLSQMSEFSFVIAAHGKAQGLINREVYFMLIGVTALSLTTTPLLWRLHDKRTEQQALTSPLLLPAAGVRPSGSAHVRSSSRTPGVEASPSKTASTHAAIDVL